MKTTLTIPQKCKVGFNTRKDTYTGKLGYIIMHDGKTWRKEASWENWREKYTNEEKLKEEKLKEFNQRVKQITDQYNYSIKNPVPLKGLDPYSYYRNKSLEEILKQQNLNNIKNFPFYTGNRSSDPTIEPVEFENVPIEGFVLNKKAGGYSSGWNHRQTVCRVYDPRGWEFEISISNLLYILESNNSIKGKGLDGKFVYSWDGKDLVLLPVDSPDYEEIDEFNKKIKSGLNVKQDDLEEGRVYLTKSGTKILYLGERYAINNSTKLYHNKVYLYLKTEYLERYEDHHLKTYINSYVNVVNSLPVLLEKKELMTEKYTEIIEKHDKVSGLKLTKDQGKIKNTYERITDPSVLNLDKIENWQELQDLCIKSKDKKIKLNAMRYNKNGSWGSKQFIKQIRLKLPNLGYEDYDLDSQALKDVFNTYEIYKKTTKIIT